MTCTPKTSISIKLTSPTSVSHLRLENNYSSLFTYAYTVAEKKQSEANALPLRIARSINIKERLFSLSLSSSLPPSLSFFLSLSRSLRFVTRRGEQTVAVATLRSVRAGRSREICIYRERNIHSTTCLRVSLHVCVCMCRHFHN